ITLDSTLIDTTLQLVTPLVSNFRYYWRVSALNDVIESSYSPTAYFVTNDDITDIDHNKTDNKSFKLYQNYPNPFNPSTNIAFELPDNNLVNISVYDELGRKVLEVVNKNYSKGYHEVRLDASKLASGIYYYRLAAGEYMSFSKFILLK
ncbi:MAG: T9SS type A sorting domain-containing protein, partial [Melioribacteraceae bacterium]|nr:T9SS type A sorting domain-containing protein [Melioribacteraceae bacterium]